MVRILTALVLLVAVVSAQTSTVSEQQPRNSSSKPATKVKVYHSLTALTRGSEEEIAIGVEGNGFLTSPRSPVHGIVPITLQLDPAEGFSVGAIEYPKPYKQKLAAWRDPIYVFRSPWQQVGFKLRAAPGAALGVHVLSGRMLFQFVSDSGLAEVEQIAVQVPVTVTNQRASVHRTGDFPTTDHMQPSGDMPLWAKIALAPLMVPLLFVMGIVCFARGQDCSC